VGEAGEAEEAREASEVDIGEAREVGEAGEAREDKGIYFFSANRYFRRRVILVLLCFSLYSIGFSSSMFAAFMFPLKKSSPKIFFTIFSCLGQRLRISQKIVLPGL
jgi:hypothetical protein